MSEIREPKVELSFMHMSKLEYFAGLAMQGLLANPYWEPDTEDDGCAVAVNWARTLCAELEKETQK